MGASSSTEPRLSPEQQQEESLAASTGSLPVLRAAFSNLSSTVSTASATIPLSSLQDAFSLNLTSLASESPPIPDGFTNLLSHIGPTVASYFTSSSSSPGATWLDLLKGYNRCCGRMPASASLDALIRLYVTSCRSAGNSCELNPGADDAEDGKVGGSFVPYCLLMLLWMCWIMGRESHRTGGGKVGAEVVLLPDVNHLVMSALVSCREVVDDEKISGCDVLGVGGSISVQKFHMWVLATAPGLAHCLSQFVQERLKACVASKNDVESVLPAGDCSSSMNMHDTHLLTCGRAWAISLAQRNALGVELLGACFPGISTEILDNLLYRSAFDGKGLTRFWSNVEGYHGPLLILIHANSKDSSEIEGDSSARKWVIGVLTEQGLENRETFYGNSGCLYAISPIFRMLPPSGKDKNFVYCHIRPTVRVYEANPKSVGLAFGGTVGNERIFIDEDFATVTIRHHAVDRTYQPGSLFPNQGFLPSEASLLEVEVWGFGGKVAKAHQDAYKRREELFSGQRRKVDLKTFGNWEDSPEKMLMDMVSDPNKVRREDR